MRFLVAIAAVWAVLAAAGPAWAGLEICNETGVTRSVAIAYSENKQWVSEGWWRVEAGKCTRVISGDLKQRYYYYRATARGYESRGDGYRFCTTGKPFTIVGDERCEARGYESSDFRKVDTGKSARDFKLTLTGATPPLAPKPPRAAAPGTYGEPIEFVGMFRGCEGGSDGYCQVETSEWFYVVPRDGRTPQSVFSRLESAKVGQRVTVAGDVVGYGDVTADVVARRVKLGPEPSALETMHARLRGLWESLDDSSETIRFAEGRYWSFYDGNQLDVGRYRFSRCLPSGDVGIEVEIEGEHEPYCYDLARVTWRSLELIYADRGNTLRYRRAE